MTNYRLNGEWPAEVLGAVTLDTIKRAATTSALRVSLARGRRRKNDADQIAVAEMRGTLNKYLMLPAIVVIGEGKLDKAPMLYVGERLGPKGDPLVELAVDPIDGTTPCALFQDGAISVIAAALIGRGKLFACNHEGYMDKFAVGPRIKEVWSDLRNGTRRPTAIGNFNPELSPFEQPLPEVVHAISYALDKEPHNLVAGMLRRPRNAEIADILTNMGVQVAYYGDGDVALGIGATDPDHHIDFALGSGGSPEATIAAAGVNVGGGDFWSKWWFPDDEAKGRESEILQGEKVDAFKIYTMDDLAQGEVMYAYAAITGTTYLSGVKSGAHNTLMVDTAFGRSSNGTDGIQVTRHRRPPEPFTDWSAEPDVEI